MANEKLTAKKVITIIGLTAIALLTYYGIILFSLPLTGSIMTSWILGLAFVAIVILCCTASMLRRRKKRGN